MALKSVAELALLIAYLLTAVKVNTMAEIDFSDAPVKRNSS